MNPGEVTDLDKLRKALTGRGAPGRGRAWVRGAAVWGGLLLFTAAVWWALVVAVRAGLL